MKQSSVSSHRAGWRRKQRFCMTTTIQLPPVSPHRWGAYVEGRGKTGNLLLPQRYVCRLAGGKARPILGRPWRGN